MTSDKLEPALDDRCSEACTRAGTFALLLSAVAIALLGPIVAANVRSALLDYISNRLALKEAVDQIQPNSCWQALIDERAGVEATKSLTIRDLLKYECKEESVSEGNNQPPKLSIRAIESIPKEDSYLVWDPPEPQTKEKAPPNPLRNLRIVQTYPLPNLDTIVLTLGQLEDVKLLNSARQYSPKFNGSIYRWQIARHQLAVRKLHANNQWSGDVKVANGGRSKTVSQSVLMMSLEDIQALTELHLPDANTFDDIRGGESRVQMPGIPFQIQLEAGTILLELAILLAVIYYWVFFREALTSPRFSAPGTLFGVFRRSHTSNAIFHLLILVPAVCAATLSFWSVIYSSSAYVRITIGTALLVVVFTIDILRLSLPVNIQLLRSSVRELLAKIKSLRVPQGMHSKPRSLGSRMLSWAFHDRWNQRAVILVLITSVTFGFTVAIWLGIREQPFINRVVSRLTQKPLPKADPHRFAVAVGHLENDPGSQYERLLLKDLEKLGGIQVLRFDRKIPLSLNDSSGKEELAGHNDARSFLSESGAQAMIWGQVYNVDGKSRFQVIWTTQSEEFRAIAGYQLADFALPDLFWSELIDVLHLLILTQHGQLYDKSDFLVKESKPLIERLKKLVQEDSSHRSWRSFQRAGIKFILAGFLHQLGSQTGEKQLLEDSVTIYREVLKELSQQVDRVNWSATQNNLGAVLQALGQREPGTKRLEEALAAYTEALREYTREREPLKWAKIKRNMGIVLQSLGDRESGTARLQQAVTVHREALEKLTREQAPREWAMAKNALGASLQSLGERESGTNRFEESAAVVQEALEVLTRETVPMEWAMTQNNLGGVLQYLGERQSNIKILNDAVTAHRQSLKEWTRERTPLNWALAQNNLGTALRRLAERESSKKQLEDAVAAHNESLKEWTRERVPLNWALAQNNLGIALRRLGERESSKKRLNEAVQAHRRALEEWKRDQMPLKWAEAHKNLTSALNSLRDLTSSRTKERQAAFLFNRDRQALGNLRGTGYLFMSDP